MKKKLSVRLLSVLLCLVMMFVCLQASASALSLDDLQQAIDKLAYYTMANLPDGLTAHLNEGWSRAKLDTADAEQLNLLTTIDPDGTKTLYSYDTPIKYVDDEGYIRFIDSSIKPTLLAESLVDWYSYENTANEVKTYFPLFINTGVLIEDNSFSIRMTPDGNNSMVGRDGDYVQYEDVFGQGVDIRYTAINTGVKEDIVIAEYNGDNTFEYIVETEGLAPIRTAGKTVEFYDYTLNLSYTFGEIVMFDADNKTATDNSYTVEELEDGKYLVTLIVDQEFLAADDTAYPVVVDPTVRQTNNDKNFCSSNYFASATYCDQSVDVLTAENGTASSAIHLQMTDMQNFSHINPEKITRAHLNLYFDQQIADEITFNVNAVNFSTEPTQASLTWDTVEQVINGSPESSMSVVSGISAVGLVITEIFRDWLTVETKSYMLSTRISKSDGLFVSATGMSDGSSIIVCAPSHPNNAVWPSVTVTYTEDDELETGFYRIQSGYYYDGARYLTANSAGNVIYDLDESNLNQLWYIEKSTDDNLYPDDDSLNGSYIIYNVGQRKYMSFNMTYNTVGWYEQFEQPAQTVSGCNLKIVGQSNGYHRIVSTGTHNQLSVLNYYKENCSPVIQDKMKGLDNQRWKFHKVDSFIVANGETSHQMVVGEKKYLSYTFVDLNATFSISSSDPDSNVISYRETSSGFTAKYITVEAVGEGSATFTVTMKTEDEETGGTKTSKASWTFTVGQHTVDIIPSEYEIHQNTSAPLKIQTNGSTSNIIWYVQEPNGNSVVTVNNGTITGKTPGKVTVVAETPSGNKDYCIVFVRRPLVNQAENIGSAKPYIPLDEGSEANCYSYALGREYYLELGNECGPMNFDRCDVEQAASFLEADLTALGIKFYRLSTINEQVYSNEYRIAFRVCTNPTYNNTETFLYHFMVQTNTYGKWAHKPGDGNTIILEQFETPDTNNDNWFCFHDNEKDVDVFYDSYTIYYAINTEDMV